MAAAFITILILGSASVGGYYYFNQPSTDTPTPAPQPPLHKPDPAKPSQKLVMNDPSVRYSIKSAMFTNLGLDKDLFVTNHGQQDAHFFIMKAKGGLLLMCVGKPVQNVCRLSATQAGLVTEVKPESYLNIEQTDKCSNHYIIYFTDTNNKRLYLTLANKDAHSATLSSTPHKWRFIEQVRT